MSSTPATSLNPSAFTLASNTASTSSAFLRPAGSMEQLGGLRAQVGHLELGQLLAADARHDFAALPLVRAALAAVVVAVGVVGVVGVGVLVVRAVVLLGAAGILAVVVLVVVARGSGLALGGLARTARLLLAFRALRRLGLAERLAARRGFGGGMRRVLRGSLCAASGMASLRVLLMRAAGLSEACSVGEPAASGAGASMSFFVRRAGFGASAAASSAAGRFAAAARRRGCWGFAGTACSAASVATGAITSFMLMPSALSPSP